MFSGFKPQTDLTRLLLSRASIHVAHTQESVQHPASGLNSNFSINLIFRNVYFILITLFYFIVVLAVLLESLLLKTQDL